jgi:hypothetical protein
MNLCKISSARTKVLTCWNHLGRTDEQGDKTQKKAASIQRGSIALLHSTCTRSISAVY